MSVDLKFTSISKKTRKKNAINDSQYSTVFLQAVINYRALLRTEYSASKNQQSTSKINSKGSNSCVLATLQPIHQILAHIASGSFPFYTQFLDHLGLKSVQYKSICPKEGNNVLLKGLTSHSTLDLHSSRLPSNPSQSLLLLHLTFCQNLSAISFLGIFLLLFSACNQGKSLQTLHQTPNLIFFFLK